MESNTEPKDPSVQHSLLAGEVYLTYSGEVEAPYRFVKILRIEGNYLWIRLFYDMYAQPPAHAYEGESLILQVSAAMFFAWGPPTFPIFVSNEQVTDAELAECTSGPNWVPPDRQIDPNEVR